MKTIRLWLTNHSITAHSVSGVWVFLVGLWAFSDPFRSYVFGIYKALPKGLHNVVAGLVIPALVYWQAQKKLTMTTTVSPGETGAAAAVASVDEPVK